MNRLFPRVVSAAIAGSAVAIGLLGGGCSPSNSVQPGAPVLVTFSLVDPSSGAYTNITADTVDCSTDITDGGDCDPDNPPVCRFMAKTYCHCDKKAADDPTILPEMPKTNGTATCTYPSNAFVYATFDRILDTAPLSPDGGQTDLVTFAAAPPPAVTVAAAATYIPDGTSMGLVFSPSILGVPLGPSLSITNQPTTPSGAAVTLTLQSDKVRAKDGKTGFVGKGGFLVGGVLMYETQAFSANITVPQPAMVDGGTQPTTVAPDATPVTVTFNNTVDASIAAHIQVTAGSAAFTDVTVDTSMLPTVTITPTTTWTPSTAFTVTVDANAADIVGDTLGTAQTGTFTTGTM